MAYQEDQVLVHELINRELVSREKLRKIQDVARTTLATDGITKTLLKFLEIDELMLAEVISEKFDIPILKEVNGLKWIDVANFSPDNISSNIRMIPIIHEKNELTVATIDPPYQKIINYLKQTTNMQIVPVVVKASDFDKLSTKKANEGEAVKPIKIDFDQIDVAKRGVKWAHDADATGELPNASKVLKELIETAVNADASDIHFETENSGYLNVRFRLGGVLQRVVTLPKSYTESMPTVLKQSGSVDSFNKKSIQEGQSIFTLYNQKIHTRINVIPTNNGEKITIRILKKNLTILNLDELGLSLHDFSRFQQMLSYPDAVVFFVGPSGCGKTTTMYSALNELNQPCRNISTVEDPIECIIDGINQTSVKRGGKIGYTQSIKALFHHDVDLLGLGEIRDREEADLIIEAGLTGMMAYTTLQASNAIKSLYRLKNLGVKLEELSLVLRGIVAQRFVRKICPNCIEEYRPENDILEKAGLINLPHDIRLKKGKGCKTCLSTGYLNRIPLFEILLVNETLSALIHKNRPYSEINKAAERTGFTTMRYDGLRKALAGITTIEEVLRVT